MKLNIIKSIILIFFSFFCNFQLNAQHIWIEPKVKEEIINTGKASAILLLQQKASLSGWQDSWSKELKTDYVYRELFKTASESQRPILDILNRFNVNYHSFWIVNAIQLELNSAVFESLSTHPEIKAILWDQPIQNFLTKDLSLIKAHSRTPELTWGLKRIGVEKVWNMGIDGTGIILAGHDTGYKWDMVGIKEQYRGWSKDTVNHNYNWHDAIHQISPLSSDSINPCGLNLTVPCDDHGHGTHTAGTMVGRTDDYAYGVAPKAKWIGCRNMERGNGAPSTYLECFEFFLAPTDINGNNPRTDLAPHAINNSWYCSPEEGCNPANFKFMEEAVDHLTLAGIVVVVSAGNAGHRCGSIEFPPAMFQNSFAVGAFAENDTISSFSSIGPVLIDSSKRVKPEVVAPGSQVLSRPLSGNLEAWNGTSMAGPHVAGLVALIIQANPLLAGKVGMIKEIIQKSARPDRALVDCETLDPEAIPNYMYGYGKIQADEAVRMAIVLRNEELNKSDMPLLLYPNPTTGRLNISQSDMLSKDQNLILLNNMGEIVLRIVLKDAQTSIDISNLPGGLYILKSTLTSPIVKVIKI